MTITNKPIWARYHQMLGSSSGKIGFLSENFSWSDPEISDIGGTSGQSQLVLSGELAMAEGDC